MLLEKSVRLETQYKYTIVDRKIEKNLISLLSINSHCLKLCFYCCIFFDFFPSLTGKIVLKQRPTSQS